MISFIFSMLHKILIHFPPLTVIRCSPLPVFQSASFFFLHDADGALIHRGPPSDRLFSVNHVFVMTQLLSSLFCMIGLQETKASPYRY